MERGKGRNTRWNREWRKGKIIYGKINGLGIYIGKGKTKGLENGTGPENNKLLGNNRNQTVRRYSECPSTYPSPFSPRYLQS